MQQWVCMLLVGGSGASQGRQAKETFMRKEGGEIAIGIISIIVLVIIIVIKKKIGGKAFGVILLRFSYFTLIFNSIFNLLLKRSRKFEECNRFNDLAAG